MVPPATLVHPVATRRDKAQSTVSFGGRIDGLTPGSPFGFEHSLRATSHGAFSGCSEFPQQPRAMCIQRPRNERLTREKEVLAEMTKLHRIAIRLLMLGVPAAFVIVETAGSGHP